MKHTVRWIISILNTDIGNTEIFSKCYVTYFFLLFFLSFYLNFLLFSFVNIYAVHILRKKNIYIENKRKKVGHHHHRAFSTLFCRVSTTNKNENHYTTAKKKINISTKQHSIHLTSSFVHPVLLFATINILQTLL